MKERFALPVMVLLALSLAVAGCDRPEYAAADQVIMEARELPRYMGKDGTVILDARPAGAYVKGHVAGAVNYPVANVLENQPAPDSLASRSKVGKSLGAAGVGNDTLVVIYDEGKSCNASRLWWTLLVYGHDKVRVVNGGLPAIEAAGIAMTTDSPALPSGDFTATDNRKLYRAAMQDARKQVDDPDPGTILLDVDVKQGKQAEGDIPGSLVMDYQRNFYADGTFLDTRATRINYLERGIRPDNTVIVYCRTSMCAAPVFLRLWDAGYRKVKLYDGTWTEWPRNSGTGGSGGTVPPPSPRDLS